VRYKNIEKKTLAAMLLLQLVIIMALICNFLSLRTLACDVQKALVAERKYTWNIIRLNHGQDPALETTELKNPLLTKNRYIYCVR